MIQRMRSYVLPLALSALFAGALGAEFVLQNGINEYDGCEDATLMSSLYAVINEEHYKEEYSDMEGLIIGREDRNYDNIPFLYVNFCPS